MPTLCIVCLTSNVRVIDINYTYLMDMFVSMAESNIQAQFGRFVSTVCIDCHKLMRQCLLFNHLEQNLLMMAQDRAQRDSEEDNDTDSVIVEEEKESKATDDVVIKA